jgi:molybdopterin synthase catalytic subunit
MQAFAIEGEGAPALADRLVARFDGRVALVRVDRTDGGLVAREGPTTTYDLSEDGWRAEGAGGSLDGLLDRLAADHDYAAVVGARTRLPTVGVGIEGDVTVEDADAALEPLVAAIGDLPRYESLESLVARVEASPRAERAGAIATFTGRVRGKEDPDDDTTEYLEFELYEGVAQRTMRAIEADLEEREGVLDVAMHHRVGVIPNGEDIVFVVVLAGHREEAFRTVEDGINRLKDEVPIFKKEVTTEETFWVHERE